MAKNYCKTSLPATRWKLPRNCRHV